MKKKELVKRICLNCSKEFYCHGWQTHKGRKKYCSKQCYWKHKSILSLGKNNPFYGKKHTEEFKRHQSLIKFKGGRAYSRSGIYIYQGKKNRYLAEHRLIAKQIIGRELTKEEIVHHIDGNNWNNNQENLLICSWKEHRRLHGLMRNLLKPLIDRGYIKFNRKEIKYEMVD